MSKELTTPLEAFNNILKMSVGLYKEDVEVVETALKALEIISKKKVDIVEFFRSPTCFAYNAHHSVFSQDLSQEEFDLLKKVLK